MFVALRIQHAVRMCHIVICGLPRSTVFFPHYLTNGTIFAKKKYLQNTKCVFWVPLQLLSETFLILRTIQRDMIKKISAGLRVKYFFFRFLMTLAFSTNMKKSDIKFRENPSIGSRVFPCGATERYDDASVRFCGLVVRVSGYRYRGPGFDPRRYQIFWVVVGLERGPLSLVRSIEELLEWKK